MKLNVGCGRNVIKGWVNLDKQDAPGVDLVVDIEDPRAVKNFRDSPVEEILLSHVFEHFQNPLQAMENLWRISKPDALLRIRCPWGGSHIAFEDPTHVRAVFLQTFAYFSQCLYGGADYGYRGDWQVEEQLVTINSDLVNPREVKGQPELVKNMLMTSWNVGKEIHARLRCVKPARKPGTPMDQKIPWRVCFDFELQELERIALEEKA